MGHHRTPCGASLIPPGSASRGFPARGAARNSIAPCTSRVTSKKSLCTHDLWAPRKLAIHLASPSKADGAALARRLVPGAPSPRTALPLPAACCWGRATSHSLGRSTARSWSAQAGKDAAALCFFPPQGSTAPAPQPITHFIDATATRRHRPISCSGRHSNGPGFGSHSHYAGQGNPTTSRLQDPAHCSPRRARQRWAVHPQQGLCCPSCCPAFRCWLAKQLGIMAPSRERQPRTGHATVPW